ncbi:RNA ligase family protein [Haliangium sp.]|uniref:RNA ligase family protein n=1 Tax=Haliangium sp. TaxID=2663208 RepID=UPI003D12E7D1
MIEPILKYPRTHHLEGSRLQPGDEDLSSVRLSELAGQHLVVEEKLDGANAGISFAGESDLRLQSRGHYLTGGYRERHFNLLKAWASAHQGALWRALGTRYIAYGEWLYAKHTVFYDQLPHYFMEFDVFDKHEQGFLSTERRHALFARTPVVSVPVLWTGPAPRRAELERLVGESLYKSARWRDALAEAAEARELDPARVSAETDPADEMEGLYVKAEQGGRVIGRYKYVRASFLTSVVDSGSHWLDRPIVPNQLADGVDIFAPAEDPTADSTDARERAGS